MDDHGIMTCAEQHGFAYIHAEELPEIDGFGYVLQHKASAARLLYLKCDDNNKGFSITFKTPAADNTGVFHILEHSVLCGSRKYPVKEPFVNLLKSSMQTFLNAMTFPDKTMYPVASTNEQDLLNLADVYMDAVFYPNIYKNKCIFEQEGWHYELEDVEGQAEGETKRLVYNGVVFNEMKGALSDAESVLYDTLCESLFPDNTYRFESGGMPQYIPTLTNEAFLDAHRRHYRPDNSYIVLYGNLNLDTFLAFLDTEYLTPLAQENICADPNPLCAQKPVCTQNITREMATAPENSCTALGYVIGTALDREKIVAISIVLDAIMGSNEAPLKRALLDEAIVDDCEAVVADSMYQPFVMVSAKGLREDAANRLEKTVTAKVKELADGALDMELVKAAFSHAEFVMREGNFGYADGVVYSMAALNGWLYDNDPSAACAYIKYEDLFADLRKRLDTSYFTDLLREIFLENDHRSQAEIIPVEADGNEKERLHLAEIEKGLTAAQLEEIAENVERLRDAQTKPDAPEDLAKLPKLSIADIGDAPDEPAATIEEHGMLSVIRHAVETHGIIYAYRYFDLDCVEFEELPYVTILAMALGKMDTAYRSASELDTLIQDKLGNLDFGCDVFESTEDVEYVLPKFVVSTSALASNVEDAAHLANEVMTQTDFHDTGKLLDMLLQKKVALEQRFAMAGHSVAISRAASYFLPASVIREKLSGIDFYVFLKDLIAHFDMRAAAVAEKLKDLAERIFTDDGCTLSFAGTERDFASYLEAGIELGIKPTPPQKALSAPAPERKNEAFMVPSDVTYTAAVADRRALVGELSNYSGTWMVLSKVLSLDYLWNEIRVLGGAYGTGFVTTRSGSSYYYSYRDPHIDETLDRFEAAAPWLKEFSPLPEEFDGYVVSTAASFDKPLKPRGLVRRQDSMYFSRYSREQFLRYRKEVIETKVRDVQELAKPLKELYENAGRCVVGNADIINQSEFAFEKVDLLAL